MIFAKYILYWKKTRFESWTYWDTADWDVFWTDGDQVNLDVVKFFSRPYPRAMAGTPQKYCTWLLSHCFIR